MFLNNDLKENEIVLTVFSLGGRWNVESIWLINYNTFALPLFLITGDTLVVIALDFDGAIVDLAKRLEVEPKGGDGFFSWNFMLHKIKIHLFWLYVY